MTQIKQNIHFIFLFFFVIIFVFSNSGVKKNRSNLSAEYTLQISTIPAKAIKIIAGEFSGLFADYLLLQIGSYVGSNTKISNNQWKMIHRGFEQAFELDPYFQQTYIQAQAFLAWEARMPKKAINLLKQSQQKRQWDWFPGYYLGFDYYYFLNDYKKASEIYLKTSKIKDAPLIIALLGSRFAIKEKRTQTSINLLELMLQDPELNENDIKEITNRIAVLKSIKILDAAIKEYKRRYSKYPSTLDDLVYYKIVSKLPKNPYKKQYQYNVQTGEISFD